MLHRGDTTMKISRTLVSAAAIGIGLCRGGRRQAQEGVAPRGGDTSDARTARLSTNYAAIP